MAATERSATFLVRITSHEGRRWQGRITHAQSGEGHAIHGAVDVTDFIERHLDRDGAADAAPDVWLLTEDEPLAEG